MLWVYHHSCFWLLLYFHCLSIRLLLLPINSLLISSLFPLQPLSLFLISHSLLNQSGFFCFLLNESLVRRWVHFVSPVLIGSFFILSPHAGFILLLPQILLFLRFYHLLDVYRFPFFLGLFVQHLLVLNHVFLSQVLFPPVSFLVFEHPQSFFFFAP